MALWVVRAGRHGEQQETAVNERLVCHAWNELPDYSGKSKDELRDLYTATYPQATKLQVNANLGQVWRFARDIQKGDLVALPLKGEASFAFGRITGEYQYKKVAPNVMHIRRVEWVKTVPVSAFPKDILYSMNAAQTVFKVERNNAEVRVNAILSQSDAQLSAAAGLDGPASDDATGDDLDLVDVARKDIIKFLQARFKGHDLAALVGAVLRAQGYRTEVSKPGPDGGVDILASSGPLGFDPPRLCVQVKSGGGAEGITTYNELRGVVAKYGAQFGLLVSWGGFTKAVISESLSKMHDSQRRSRRTIR